MIHTLSGYISSFFINKKIITESEKKVYEYCFELLIAEFINIITIFIIMIISRQYLSILLFLVSFLPLRKWAGGYHADTHFHCTFILFITLSILVVLTQYIPGSVKCILQLINAVISLIVVCYLAPVDNSNKPINEVQKSRYRNISIIISLILSSIIGILSFYGFEKIFEVSYGMIVVAISMIAAKLKDLIFCE